jgi:hypothetical protein
MTRFGRGAAAAWHGHGICPKHAGMADDDIAHEIARLEAEIERLASVAEGCRKIMLASRVAIAIGAVLLVTSFAGLIRFDQLIVIASIVAVLGGIVGLGSNNTTLRQVTADLAQAEALRSQLIGRIELTVVTDAGGQPGRETTGRSPAQ